MISRPNHVWHCGQFVERHLIRFDDNTVAAIFPIIVASPNRNYSGDNCAIIPRRTANAKVVADLSRRGNKTGLTGNPSPSPARRRVPRPYVAIQLRVSLKCH